MAVAVVILNWNGRDFLERFIPTLMQCTRVGKQKSALGSRSAYPDNASVFVADNGSTDDSLNWLEWAYPQHEINIIRLDRNYGFAEGYNRAFQQIRDKGKFKYYLLLNSDVEVTDGWLAPLVEFMDSHPQAGACCPKVLSYHHPNMFEHAGAAGGYLDRFYFPYCRGRVLSRVEEDRGQYDEPAQVFWASGTSLMIRSSLWHKLGGLDGSFFAHMEEIDLCWRVQMLGYQIWCLPSSRIYHIGGGTLPYGSENKVYLNFRNNLLMMQKNLPKRGRGRRIFVRKCIDNAIAIGQFFIGKSFISKAIFHAHRDFKAMRPSVAYPEIVVPLKRSRRTLIGLMLSKP
ncbi:MAG: glycosyltransferase family 2 protein [Bacteroidales bacterium]|nr:glycosyltransferase family 2 protein [Bacteroidales bacterium]